jgi:serine/threonine-protein kinase
VKVPVPRVTGLTEQAAGAVLRKAHLEPTFSLAASSTVPSGLVISQSPPAGRLAPKGSSVKVVVSGGPASAALVNVEGLTAAQATSRLRKAGFKPTTRDESSSTVASGRVIGTDPPAGTELQVGSPVVVRVSSGPEPVRVPDVTGEPLSAAEASLTNVGLKVGKITKRATIAHAPDTVLSQSPATGTSVKATSKVDLVVAEAPKEATVPNVVGESETLALVTLGQAGFKPKTSSVTTSEASQVGIVLRQTPSAGVQAPKGSVVTIAVGVLAQQTTTTETTTTATTPTPPPAASGG